MSDEQPPFDLKDFAIEGWEATARFCEYPPAGWEVVWRREARHIAYYLQAQAWDLTRPERRPGAIQRVVEHVRDEIEWRDRNKKWE